MRLLVADDDEQWRNIIASVLEAECDLVGFVERGDQVIEAAQRFRPEVITLDVRMPGQSGINVLPRLRAVLPKAIIVIISTTMTPVYREEAFARGADGYVEKARVLRDLIDVLASVRNETGSEA